MKRLLFAAIVMFVMLMDVFSQPMPNAQRAVPISGTIVGKIVDSDSNVPLEYANVAIYSSKDSSLIGGGIADAGGIFTISNIAPGDYYLDAKFIGYERTTKHSIRIKKDKFNVDLGVIELKLASENLQDVNVYSQDKPIVYQIDKKIIDPAQFPTAANGTAIDVLANTPSISVDIEGNISMRGSSNFTVLIDGRPTPFDPADALEQIPASQIRNIEIITNPSAKYDPDGNSGIININTKKSKLSGFSGILNATADTYGSISGDLLLNYKTGKFNFYLGGNKANRYGQGSMVRIDSIFGIDTIVNRSEGENERGRDSWSVKTGFDYYINDFNTLTFNVDFNGRSRVRGGFLDFYESSTSGIERNSLTESRSTGNRKNVALSLDYKKTFKKDGQEFTAFLYYERGPGEELSYFKQFNGDSVLYNGQDNWESGDGTEIRFKADYIHPFTEKMKIETGYQVRIDREFEWNDVLRYSSEDYIVPNHLESDYYTDSEFSRDIHSLYATWSNLGKIIGVQLGLRAEYTNRSIDYSGATEPFIINRLDWFPTIHLSSNLPWDQQLTASYSRRIERPHGFFLEPFKTYVDAYNIRQGNPEIEPEYIDSYELGYQKQFGKKGFLSAEAYHRQTNNSIQSIRSIYSDSIMLQSIANIGTDYSTGIELMLNYNPVKWWMFNLMGNVYHYRIVGNLDGVMVDRGSDNWNARMSNTFTLTKTTKLQFDAMYNSPTTTAQGTREGFAFTNIAVRQDFFQNKLNVTLSVRDVFDTAKFGFESQGPGFHSKVNVDLKSPVFAITLSYKINNYKQKKDGSRGEGGNGEMMDIEGGGME